VQFVLYSVKDFSSARCSEITTTTPREGFLRGLLRTFLSSLNAPHSLLSVHCVKTKKLLLVYDFTFFSCGSYANFEKRGWQLVCLCVCVCFVEGEFENRSVGFMLGWFSICSTLLIYSRCHFSITTYNIYLTTMSGWLGSSTDALYGILSCCLRDTVVLCCGQHSGLMTFHSSWYFCAFSSFVTGRSCRLATAQLLKILPR